MAESSKASGTPTPSDKPGRDDGRSRKDRLLDELATAHRLGHQRPAGGPASPSPSSAYDRSSPAALAGSIRARRPR